MNLALLYIFQLLPIHLRNSLCYQALRVKEHVFFPLHNRGRSHVILSRCILLLAHALYLDRRVDSVALSKYINDDLLLLELEMLGLLDKHVHLILSLLHFAHLPKR